MRKVQTVCVVLSFIVLNSCTVKHSNIEETDKPKYQVSSHSNINNQDDEYYIADISNEFIGTYIPEITINKFDQTNSYSQTIKYEEGDNFHDVLAVNKNIVYSMEGYNKSSVLKHPKIHLTRYRDEKVRQRF